jgi:hypothetical protein
MCPVNIPGSIHDIKINDLCRSDFYINAGVWPIHFFYIRVDDIGIIVPINSNASKINLMRLSRSGFGVYQYGALAFKAPLALKCAFGRGKKKIMRTSSGSRNGLFGRFAIAITKKSSLSPLEGSTLTLNFPPLYVLCRFKAFGDPGIKNEIMITPHGAEP